MGSSPSSVRIVKFSGTFHKKAYESKQYTVTLNYDPIVTLPSSEPEATNESLNGLLRRI